MQTLIAAAKIEQRIAVRLEPGVIDLADEDQMVAALMHREGAAIE